MKRIHFLSTLMIAVLLTGCAQIKSLTPPEMLPPEVVKEVKWLNQNWSNDDRYWFHHQAQGAKTLPIPYKWFVALEQPKLISLGVQPLFVEPDYLERFGFIRSPKSEGKKIDWSATNYQKFGYVKNPVSNKYEIKKKDYNTNPNPDGLPIGFTKVKTVDNKPEGIGLTCAACHTGQMVSGNVRYLIDGAPAMMDLGKFNDALGAAIAQTFFFPLKFSRFADLVIDKKLAPEARSAQEIKLRQALVRLVALGKAKKEITGPVSEEDVATGYGRLDALNGMLNQVFFDKLISWGRDAFGNVKLITDIDDRDIHGKPTKLDIKSNFTPRDAPVNFPHLWDTSWFKWVQYDGSIMQPNIRNAGEALGLKSDINLTDEKAGLYDSSVQLEDIFDMEMLLAGNDHPKINNRKGEFSGLRAPVWPAAFGEIDDEKRNKGKSLYVENCQKCHLAPPDDPSFWQAKYNGHDQWVKVGTPTKEGEKPKIVELMDLKIKNVGTDPAQANVMFNRSVKVPRKMGIRPKHVLCGGDPNTNQKVYDDQSDPIYSNPKAANALAVVVEKTVEKWYKKNHTPDNRQQIITGVRPNCIQAGNGKYKARPLDGIWATAPFLHNGSVPNIYALLSPIEERPKKFCMGGQEFDLKNIGFPGKQVESDKDCGPGQALIDTTIAGNRNLGHEFWGKYKEKNLPDELKKRKVGRFLTAQEREDIIEYLKGIKPFGWQASNTQSATIDNSNDQQESRLE